MNNYKYNKQLSNIIKIAADDPKSPKDKEEAAKAKQPKKTVKPNTWMSRVLGKLKK